MTHPTDNDAKPEDSQLHCLVDGEVDRSEHAEIMSFLENDDDLRTRACNLSHQKELIRMAYAGITEPSRQGKRKQPLWAMAASVLLAITGGIALFSLGQNSTTESANADAQRMVLLDADGSGQELADPARDETRIVFQLTNPESAKATEVLDEIEGVLNFYAETNSAIRVELVAHGEGLSLMRSRLSKHADRIADLNHRFDNLTFVACNNTITRISNEQGFGVEVLPQVVVIQSGVNHVAKRQTEGWAYIHL